MRARAADWMIDVHEVVKEYDSVRAVDRLSFHVKSGETYGLLGPNGAGKTSTMRMLSALSPITAGQITVAGMDVAREGRRVRTALGVVTQQDGLDSDLTVRQNLVLHGFLAGLSRAEAGLRADEVLDFFGLTERSGSEVDQLSGGMKRRLTIARAFLTRPQVMVMDEPTTGLDPQSRNRVWEQLTVLKSSGVTILMSTHYMEEAATLCDRVGIMDHGRLLDEGAPDELVTRHAGTEVAQLRVFNGAKQALTTDLAAAGFQIREVGAVIAVGVRNGDRAALESLPAVSAARITYRPSNLEDVFLTLTGRDLRDE